MGFLLPFDFRLLPPRRLFHLSFRAKTKIVSVMLCLTVKKMKNTRKTKTHFESKFDAPWIKLAYVDYYKNKFDDRTDWAPDTICDRCYIQLFNWYHRFQRVRLFVRPVCWLNSLNHESECFFLQHKPYRN